MSDKLTPKQPLGDGQLSWGDLDRQLKLFIKNHGDTTMINVDRYPYPKSEIIQELKHQNYDVKESDSKFIYAVG